MGVYMAIAALPSLSEHGWITNPIEIADMLFSHFFISEYSQTYLFKGKIASLPYILQQDQDDLQKMGDNVGFWLKTLFSNYFQNTDVSAIVNPNADNPNKHQLTIYVQFQDKEGKTYSLGKLIEISDLTIRNIININNG